MTRRPYLAVAGAVAALAAIGFSAPPGALLPALLFWVAVGQGAVALAAAGDLTRARWIAPLRGALLAVHPLLLVFPFAFLVFARGLSVYAWAQQPSGWLSPGFFVARNAALLLAVWFLALLYARSVAGDTPRRSFLAGLYALVFVFSQTIIAFDWVMSLEYPWVSTLFGGYFFVEALYAGVAVAALTAARQTRRGRGGDRAALLDAATLLFGFSLLWAGQFFAQYLVIWYGNLPHEVDFLLRRLGEAPLRRMATLVLAGLFFIPFVLLLSRSAKASPAVVAAMALVVLAGILAERLLFLIPVLALPAPAAALAFLALGAAFAGVWRGSA
ncbi:MAG: hypothetical protein FJY75_03710 [Candidatus Eisenbacteria bacterium]|uniref:Uncharacterized protein n=1 Tax=Eiseniibacteriota bacterium TaxID=2212470 RepID=A0A937X9G3_UNCEI|nr:hypothetical protein [Candidatus Eisenbacteria bacterium]